MRHVVPLAILLSLTVVAGARAADAPSQDDVEERLLRAELLEVSAGDLDGAMTVYRELAADESAPARVRARSLLCLGRCRRKLAQLDEARSTLEELIASYPEERETVRTARGFLRELQEGRAENPDFDWISEIQKSPEIQARVFDLAMELVDPYTDDGRRAAGQLVALGAIAVPVLDRLIETSRDSLHRQRMALIAVENGRLERLDVLLGSGAPATILYGEPRVASSKVEEYLRHVPELPEADKRRLLDVLDSIEIHPDAEPWAAMLRLLAGDRNDTGAQLDLIEKEPAQLVGPDLVRSLLGAREDLVDVLAGRILERERPIAVRRSYTLALERTQPQALTSKHSIATIDDLPERDSVTEHFLREAMDRGDFEVLAAVAPGKAQLVMKVFARDYGAPQKVKSAPDGWASVLREVVLRAPDGESEMRHMAFGFLKIFAFSSEEAARAYGDVLRERPVGIPSERPSPSMAQDSVPSPALAEVLATVLDEDDPVALALALDTLAFAPAGVGPEIVAPVETLLERTEDPLLRQLALYALLRRLPGRPETGPDVARLLVGEAERELDSGGEESSSESPLLGLKANAWIGVYARADEDSSRRTSGAVRPLPLLTPEEPSLLSAKWAPMGESLQESWEDLPGILPHLLALPSSEARNEVLRWVWSQDWNRITAAIPSHLRAIVPFEDRILIFNLVRMYGAWSAESGSPVATFLEALARDDRVPLQTRLEVVESAAGTDGYDWLDWARLVREHGDVLEEYGWPFELSGSSGAKHYFLWLGGLATERQCTILKALLESEREGFRKTATALYPHDAPNFPSVMEAGLRDPATRGEAVTRIVEWAERSTAAAPLLVRALAYPELQRDPNVHAALRRLAVPQTIEPLAELLESPDPTVQELALASLKSIRETMEERRAWTDILEQLRGSRGQAPKEAKP